MRRLLLSLSLLTATVTTSLQAAQSYQQALTDFQTMSKKSKGSMTAKDKATMKRFNEQLAAKMTNPGIQVGENAPDFVLSNAFGKQISLKDELKKGPVVLIFYRGSWCPYCNLHLRVLQKHLPTFKQYGAQLITVSPQKPDKSAEQLKKDGYLFEALSDTNNQVMKDYNLYFELSDDMQSLYKKFGIDLAAHNGNPNYALPVPGGFVIDKQGVVQAMTAQTDYKTRMEPALVIETLKRLSGGI